MYYMADPRNINDLEEENINLKEQMIHAMLTLEQYLSVAYMKFNEDPSAFQNMNKMSDTQTQGNGDYDGKWQNY